MNKFCKAADRYVIWGYMKGNEMRNRVVEILRRKEGEGFVETAIFC